VLGTVAGIDAITLDDVKQFWKTVRARRRQGGHFRRRLRRHDGVADAGAGCPAGRPGLAGHGEAGRPQGARLEVEILEKNTRATAISFGLPLDVNRTHPDFPPCGWRRRGWASTAPRIPTCTSASAKSAA
jgi:zinc protease